MKKKPNPREMHLIDVGKATKGYSIPHPNGSSDVWMAPAFVDPPQYDNEEDSPDKIENFVWDMNLVSKILIAWIMGMPLNIVGPPGSGKTEHIIQLAIIFNWELVVIECEEEMQKYQLLGRDVVKDDETAWADAGVADAFRYGKILLLDEYHTLSGGLKRALNRLSDINPRLNLSDNHNERLHCVEYFGLFATSNCKDFGDIDGRNPDAAENNTASANRFSVVEVDYQPEDVEVDILVKSVPELANLDESTPLSMVQLGNMVRSSIQETSIPIDWSMRTLIQWAKWQLMLGDCADAFKTAFYSKLENLSHKSAVVEAYELVFEETLEELEAPDDLN